VLQARGGGETVDGLGLLVPGMASAHFGLALMMRKWCCWNLLGPGTTCYVAAHCVDLLVSMGM
jgi:hypothetical protein